MSEAPGPLRRWVLAARPRTLPAAMVPVIVGVALIRPRTINWGNSVLCLLVALALQVGTNYANDYSDGIRGTDEVRVGPFRLTASKLVAAKIVRNAAFTAFFLAGAIDFGTAMELAAYTGRSGSKRYNDAPPGTMAILGCGREAAQRIVEALARRGVGGVGGGGRLAARLHIVRGMNAAGREREDDEPGENSK